MVTRAIVDCDGDGKPDLVRGMSIWRGDGAGSFTFHTNLIPPEQVEMAGLRFVATADFNGDRKPDLCFGFNEPPRSHFDVWTNAGAGCLRKFNLQTRYRVRLQAI